jgi:hypothetical protein
MVAALRWALDDDDDMVVWCDIFAVRQWGGNDADLVFEPVVAGTKSLVLVCKHLDSVARMSFGQAISANTAIPADALQSCAFFRVWCLVELASALRSNKPVVLVVGDIDVAGQFLPMPKMLQNLYYLVSIAKADSSNPIDLRRELGKIKHAPGLHAMDTLLRGAITGAQFVMDFPDVMRAACGQDVDGMAFSSMKPARRNDLLRAASAAGFLEVTKVLLACGAELDEEEFAGSGMTALMHASLGGHTSVIEALIAKGAEVNLVQNEMFFAVSGKVFLEQDA